MDLFKDSSSIARFIDAVTEKKSVISEGLFPSAKAAILAIAQKATGKSILLITGSSVEEFKVWNDLALFTKVPIVELPAWETLPQENVAPSPDIVGSRFKSLQALLDDKTPKIVLTTLQSCLQKVLSPAQFSKKQVTLKQGQKQNFEDCIKTIAALGFERKTLVVDKGEFAVRGGLIDIFPVTALEPYRIEFWGNEIESIRAFDPGSQKSTSPIKSIEITPAKEMEFLQTNSDELSTIFDYLGSNILIVLDNLEDLEDRYAELMAVGSSKSRYFLHSKELFNLIDKKQTLFWSKEAIESLSDVKTKSRSYSVQEALHDIEFSMFDRNFNALRWNHPFETVPTYLTREAGLDEELDNDLLLPTLTTIHKQFKCLFVIQNDQEKATLQNKLEANHIPFSANSFLTGYLSSGFVVQDSKLLLFPLTELTHRIKIRRERQRTSHHFIPTDAFDILPGETVVHYHHGIGKFLGVSKRPNHQGVEQEFFLIEYAENAKMFVPLTAAHLITKYVGASEEIPKLHTLGSNRWKKQRETTEKAILGFAAELLKLYAERQVKGGFVFQEDSNDTKAFEDEFPYIETDDQLRAIIDVKSDMCSQKAMDRLICGDVGYGKTEVALRAAFKAVKDGGKQVAFLVPTTVLAVQHYENFLDRMDSFGIKVGVLSRFQKAAEIKKSLKDLADGSLHVIVGTHRILQSDIKFHNLGLIIIDEEQRFGVKAKEHLKRLKTNVDCLTLTATPIPRTLYMSLVGARDLSAITTPPQDRLPIKTIIADPDDHTIQTALLRELTRDGQVYYIHNRVESIYEVANHIQKLVPKARVVVGHGQMNGDELDHVFHTFKKGDADILVATSIVENGIDIPNANTIIVDNADWFGIADLYQLRGRVGRWNRRAYAYFLIPKRRALSEIARKRIEAIASASGYGGGMKVAMRDLEMRGAGDILGTEQSGHVADIGFHLYCKLLKRTIDSMQGKIPTWTLETKIEIPFDARLPETYVNDVTLRMEIYQRLGDALSLEEVDTIFNEIKDRFGKPPEQALWLYHQSRIRVFAASRGFTLVKLDNLSLIYEKKSGQESISNKVLIGRITKPDELEIKVCYVLQK